MEKHTATPEDSLKVTMGAIDAIYARRSVRGYTDQTLSYEVIHSLLMAAVQAPTAVDEQPWAFVVIEHKDILKRMSDTAKETMNDVEKSIHVPGRKMVANFVPPDDFFHGAAALIVIYGKSMGPFVAADCWLAAENLMLAACAMGLGTCAIGLAVSVLNRPEWKKELGVADDMTAIAPIVVGIPSGVTKPVRRKEPQILLWK
jgi:nitroreductase